MIAWFTSGIARGQLGSRGHPIEVDLWRKMTFDGRWPSTEDNLRRKTTFDERRPLTEDNLWWKTTFDGRRPLTEDDLQWKTTFDRVYSILPEKNVFDSSSWQLQHSWTQIGNPISCLSRKKNFMWWKKCMRHYTCTCVKKRQLFRQRRLDHSGGGEELHLEEWTGPELTQP